MAMGELGRAVILLQLLVLFMGADDVAGQLARKYCMLTNCFAKCAL